MHIPDSMLNGAVCPVTATISALGIAVSAYAALKSKKRPTAKFFAAITALIFAGQMMNFPILNGTSGHLLGGVLASSLMGTPFGVLSIATIVTIQSLVFSDGGLTVLGANIFNMAIIGAGLGGIIYFYLTQKTKLKSLKFVCVAVSAWLSVFIAAFAVSIELSLSGTIPFSKVALAMLSVHFLIGIGEALITALCFFAISQDLKIKKSKTNIVVAASVIVALLLSPFASSFPDGLEWVAEQYSFLHESAPAFVGILSDYTTPFINNEILSTGISGLLGVTITFFMAWLIGNSVIKKTA